MKYGIIIAVLSLCVIAGCNKGTRHSVPEDLIYIDKDTVPEWTLPQEELEDTRVRLTGPGISMIYSDGGIIVEQSKEKYRSVRMVELASGHTFTMTSAGVKDDELLTVKVSINGNDTDVKSATIVHKSKAGVWIDLLTPAHEHYLLVIE